MAKILPGSIRHIQMMEGNIVIPPLDTIILVRENCSQPPDIGYHFAEFEVRWVGSVQPGWPNGSRMPNEAQWERFVNGYQQRYPHRAIVTSFPRKPDSGRENETVAGPILNGGR